MPAVRFSPESILFLFRGHSLLLKPVSRPQRPIIQVPAWLTFFDKFACIKNPVVGLKP
jgi:hypothetical protein